MRIHKITRRNFMKVAGVSALAMGLAACGGNAAPAETKAAPAETKAPATEAAADVRKMGRMRRSPAWKAASRTDSPLSRRSSSA